MNNELKELKALYQDLYSKSIYAYKLEIIDELECQLENEISDEDYQKLYYEIERVYFKTEGLSIENITRCAVDNLDKIINEDSNFDLQRECYWYE